MHSITFEHRYLLRRTLPSRPPLYLTPLAPSTSFSRYPSLSLSLSPSLSPPFSRALALTPSLPAADAPTPLSHSCLSFEPSLCTRMHVRGEVKVTVTRVHFLTRMSTSEVPRARRVRRHGVYTILRPLLRVAYPGLPLFLSLSLSPSLSLSFGLTSPLYPSRSRSPLHSPLLRGRRLWRTSRERSGRRTTGELAGREIEICFVGAPSCVHVA